MKKNVGLLAVIIVLFQISCSNSKKENLKIGVNLPLTGTVSYYGISARNGIELAKEELLQTNDFKNHGIEIVYEDNQGQGKQAVTAMNKLVNIDKTPAVIGGGTSTETMSIAPVAEETKTVLISPISSASSIANAGSYIFRTCPSDLAQAHDLADWIKEQNISKVAVIYVNSTWGTGFKDNFVDHFKSIGGNILTVVSTDPGESNFRTQLSSLKSFDSEANVFIIYAKEGGALVRQAKELNVKGKIFGADPWSQKDFRTGAGDFSEGIMYTTPSQSNGTGFKQFRDAYLKKYNTEPDVYASNGYDCMKLLAKIYSSGARSGEEFQKALAKVSGFEGATGTTTFDSNGDVVGKKFGRFIISNGSPVQVIKNK